MTPLVRETCKRERELGGDEETASVDSVSTVSLSDVESPFEHDDATSQRHRPILVNPSDLETSSSNSDAESVGRKNVQGSDSDDEGERKDVALDEEKFQQQLSVMKCRYRAELEKIEDEIAAAENSYFGTRRTRVGSILKGYGDYATSNMEIVRNKGYCKPVKLNERAFSLSSKRSKIHREYEEECKNEALRREAQLAVGYGYYPPGMDPSSMEQSLNNMTPRMTMDYFPPTCRSDGYGGYSLGGPLNGHPSDGSPYGQGGGYRTYLYAPPPHSTQMFLSYGARPSIPVQTPQMMGPSMRLASSSQPFLTATEDAAEDPAASLAQVDYVLGGNASMKRPPGEEDLTGGDSNFNVEQFLNVDPSGTGLRKSDA